MKRLTLFMLVIASAASLACAADETPSVGAMGLTFSLRLPKAEFTAGEPIPLRLVVRNTSEHARRIPAFIGGNTRDGVPLLRWGARLVCHKDMRTTLRYEGTYVKATGGTVVVDPGATHEGFELDLAKCFTLGEGPFEIQLMLASLQSLFPDAASNRLKFSVRNP